LATKQAYDHLPRFLVHGRETFTKPFGKTVIPVIDVDHRTGHRAPKVARLGLGFRLVVHYPVTVSPGLIIKRFFPRGIWVILHLKQLLGKTVVTLVIRSPAIVNTLPTAMPVADAILKFSVPYNLLLKSPRTIVVEIAIV
jgi:hypothetical protein